MLITDLLYGGSFVFELLISLTVLICVSKSSCYKKKIILAATVLQAQMPLPLTSQHLVNTRLLLSMFMPLSVPSKMIVTTSDA